jgi:hypothetical protein
MKPKPESWRSSLNQERTEYRADRNHEPRAPGDQMRRISPKNDLTNVSFAGGAIGPSELPWPYL